MADILCVAVLCTAGCLAGPQYTHNGNTARGPHMPRPCQDGCASGPVVRGSYVTTVGSLSWMWWETASVSTGAQQGSLRILVYDPLI